MNTYLRFLLAPAISLLVADFSTSQAETLVCPRPAIEEVNDGSVALAKAGQSLAVTIPDEFRNSRPVQTGLTLLERRLQILGGAGRADPSAEGTLVLQKIPISALGDVLSENGGQTVCPEGLEHGYILDAKGDQVTLRAGGPLGIYYGLLTLCQLAEKNAGGEIVCRQLRIADAPAIEWRLAKTSASVNPPEKVRQFAAWFPLMKLNLVGLQYHGENSKSPDANFRSNVENFCRANREQGILDVVVYFCPFRSPKGKAAGAYDFSLPDDRKAYVDLLRSFLGQGARGIEIDYNDWPGREGGTPIEEVINLACDGIAEKYPDALILYCPPNKGSSTYRGPATPEMTRILSEVPEKVWPLWTGMKTLIDRPLTPEQVEAWTQAAGRRPFLWVNRVSLGVAHQFAREVPGHEENRVFRGDYLPKDLNRLFEGVHFNAGISDGYGELSGEITSESLVFVATGADFVWNPRDWTASGSWRRARRFVEIMTPLLKQDVPGAGGGR